MQRFTRLLLSVTATLSVAWCGIAAAFENGPIPGHTGALGQPDCSACHFDNEVNSKGGSVTLSKLPDIYSAGQQYSISVALADDAMATGGFQLMIGSPDGGPVGDLDSHKKDVAKASDGDNGHSYIQHRTARDKRTDQKDIQWTIVWTAPDSDAAIIIAVAAVAANDDASPLGDKVYTRTARVNAAGADTKNEDRRQK